MALLSAIAVLAVVIVAVADHRSKQHRMLRADVARWYCTHKGLRCQEEKPEAIERRWNKRERVYAASVALLLIGGASAVYTAVRRRQSGQ